jgi:plasmid stabilization system protein ParE
LAGDLGRGKRAPGSHMPQVIFAPAALRDLQRLRKFLRQKNPAAAARAASAIVKGVLQLGLNPTIGRLSGEVDVDDRELPIAFGDTDYVARYRYVGETVIILAIRHQKEAGF